MGLLLVLTALCAGDTSPPAPVADARLGRSELSAALGAFTMGYVREYGWEGGTFAALSTEGRLGYGRFLAEGGLYLGLPVTPGGPRGAGALAVRVGLRGTRVLGSLGAFVQYTPSAVPWSVLPSANLGVQLGPVLTSLGLFDRFAMVPARLSAEYRGVGVGWLFPLGGELFARLPLGPVQAEARLLAFSFFRNTTVLFTVGVAWTLGGDA